MYSKFMKFVRDYSLIEAGAVFFSATALIIWIIHSQLPVWMGCILSVLLLFLMLWSIPSITLRKLKKLIQAEQQLMDNLTLEDFHKMYSECVDLVEEQVRVKNYDRELINENWLVNYHKLFYNASRMLDRESLTDFHIAACMIFSLISRDDSLSHAHFVYDCIKNLISKPRVHFRHFGYAGMITLEVTETLQEANLSILGGSVSEDEICKIIKEVYINSNNEHALIGLADFLKSIYNRCL